VHASVLQHAAPIAQHTQTPVRGVHRRETAGPFPCEARCAPHAKSRPATGGGSGFSQDPAQDPDLRSRLITLGTLGTDPRLWPIFVCSEEAASPAPGVWGWVGRQPWHGRPRREEIPDPRDRISVKSTENARRVGARTGNEDAPLTPLVRVREIRFRCAQVRVARQLPHEQVAWARHTGIFLFRPQGTPKNRVPS